MQGRLTDAPADQLEIPDEIVGFACEAESAGKPDGGDGDRGRGGSAPECRRRAAGRSERRARG